MLEVCAWTVQYSVKSQHRPPAPWLLSLPQVGVSVAYEEILYSSSGALANLSRHPGNRDLMYRYVCVSGRVRACKQKLSQHASKPPRALADAFSPAKLANQSVLVLVILCDK